MNISTHAPAGGATEANTEPITITREISTHAPAGGATAEIMGTFAHDLISTHAPAGGATLLIGNGCGLRPHFYSRPCGRGDRSRPPADLGGSYFYSRPCGRGDARVMVALADESISTHAPAGGATGGRGLLHQDGNHFYSRPCGRGDYHAVDTALFGNLISTHAPAGGATVANNYTGSLPYLFLLTPLREGRQKRVSGIWPL